MRHCSLEVDPEADSVSSGHAMHMDLLFAPLAFENVFSGHSMHCASELAPATSRYLPAPQALHAVAPLLA